MKVKVGDFIVINKMEGEPSYSGKSGVVEHIDSIGQLHGTCGGLAVNLDFDTIQIIE